MSRHGSIKTLTPEFQRGNHPEVVMFDGDVDELKRRVGLRFERRKIIPDVFHVLQIRCTFTPESKHQIPEF